MKKQLLIVGIIVLLVAVGLSGCNEQTTTKTDYNIGDSIDVGNIRYTFLSAQWVESWGSYSYQLTIKGENLAKSETTGIVAIMRYEMKNGYTYDHNLMYDGPYGTQFTINPGKEQTLTSTSYSGEIDRDFLPVSKIYLNFRKIASNGYSYDFIKAIVLNV